MKEENLFRYVKSAHLCFYVAALHIVDVSFIRSKQRRDMYFSLYVGPAHIKRYITSNQGAWVINRYRPI